MKKLFSYILYAYLSHHVMSQGCSDAGFCTMGALRPNQKYNKGLNLKIRTLEYTSYAGIADFKLANAKVYDVFLAQIIDANIGITTKSSLQVKLPINTTLGNLGNVTGLSDLSVCFTNNILTNRAFLLNATFGMKLPLGKPNRSTKDGRPLPMYYQPTLGTYDIISGLSLTSDRWLLAAGFQYPITSAQNEFLWSYWNHTKDSAVATMYPRANSLKRGHDVMLRVERNFRFSKYNAYIGLLPIYRLNKDQFLNTKTQRYETVDGSNGLAMTLLLGGGYRFSVHSGLKLLTGLRVARRVANPDGLSRLAVTSLTYEYIF